MAVEIYAPGAGAARSDGAISDPSNRANHIVGGRAQTSWRAVRRRFFRALSVCDKPPPKPAYLSGHLKILIEIYAPAGALVGVGPTPNPNGSPSFVVPERQNFRVPAFSGDKLAWSYLVQ